MTAEDLFVMLLVAYAPMQTYLHSDPLRSRCNSVTALSSHLLDGAYFTAELASSRALFGEVLFLAKEHEG